MTSIYLKGDYFYKNNDTITLDICTKDQLQSSVSIQFNIFDPDATEAPFTFDSITAKDDGASFYDFSDADSAHGTYEIKFDPGQYIYDDGSVIGTLTLRKNTEMSFWTYDFKSLLLDTYSTENGERIQTKTYIVTLPYDLENIGDVPILITSRATDVEAGSTVTLKTYFAYPNIDLLTTSEQIELLGFKVGTAGTDASLSFTPLNGTVIGAGNQFILQKEDEYTFLPLKPVLDISCTVNEDFESGEIVIPFTDTLLATQSSPKEIKVFNGIVDVIETTPPPTPPDIPDDLRFRMKIETTGDYKSAISNAVGTEANAKAVVDAFDGWIYSTFTTDNQPPAFYPDTNIPSNFNLDYCTEWYSPIYNFFETKLNEILYTSFFGYPGAKPWKIGAPVGTPTDDTFRLGGVYDYLHVFYEPGFFKTPGKDSKVIFVGTKEVFEDQSSRIDIYMIIFYTDSDGVERRDVAKVGFPMEIFTDVDALENMGKPSEPSNNTGTYDDNSDNIQPTEYPLTVDNGGTEQDILVPFNPMGASDAGLITLWKVTLADLDSLGDILWSSDFSSTVSKVFLSPIDAIISLNLIPYGGAEGIGQGILTYGTDNLALGGYGTGIRPKKLASQFFYVDMGHYIFEEYWASALDYDPYTKIQMYLPFIGSVDLSPDDVMSKRIDLEYVIDTLTGQLAARLYVSPDRATKGGILCTYSGNCSINIPITGANYGEIYRSVISASVNTATSLMSLGSGGGVSNVVSSLGSTAADMVSGSKAKYERAGSIGLTSSYLACLTPFIIITRPKQSLAADYNKYEGYPSNITSKLKGLKGFTVVESIHLDNISATEKELNEIESLLSKGVII